MRNSSKQHRKPCRECPFRRASSPGYLGASEPLDFVKLAASETRMPCHLRVDYDRKDWEAQAATAPQCVGRAILTANTCTLPRSGDLLTAKPNRSEVFTHPLEMLEHHGGKESDLVAFIRWRSPFFSVATAKSVLEQWREWIRRKHDPGTAGAAP
jgi:hypothetical protein